MVDSVRPVWTYAVLVARRNKVLMVHTQWLPGVQLKHFSTTCVVHIQKIVRAGAWLSGCRSSVAEHWLYKRQVVGSIPGGCRPFHFPLFLPLNSLYSNMYKSSKIFWRSKGGFERTPSNFPCLRACIQNKQVNKMIRMMNCHRVHVKQ